MTSGTGSDPGHGGFVEVARSLSMVPGDLEILRARLASEGIPAFIADGNTTQMNALWTLALGGTRLMVPDAHARAAREILALLQSGVFDLGADEDAWRGDGKS